MKYIFFIISFFIFNISFSQEKELDSIKKLLDSHTKRDTTRVYLLNQITTYYTSRDNSKSIEVLNEAIAIAKEIDYKMGLANSYYNYSTVYILKGNYDKGLTSLLKAKKLQDELQDKEGIIYTNLNISRVYINLNKTKEAIAILLENIELLKDQQKSKLKASNHFYIASAYTDIKEYEKAIYHYNESKKIAKLNNNQTGIVIANSSLGSLENKLKNFSKAKEHLEKSLTFFTKYNHTANIAHSKLELSNTYAGLNNLPKAISYIQDAIKFYQKEGDLNNLERAYFELSNYYKKQKNYKFSNTFLTKHYIIKDSIFKMDKVKVMEEMQTKYKTEKIALEKEVAIERSKKDKGILYVTILLFGILTIAALSFFGRFKAKKKNELVITELKETQKRLAIEKQYRDSELKALKAQMNPHFIFNALNSIQDYIVLNQKNLASDYLGKFADLIRNYLHFSNTGFISVKEEIHNLNLYLDLEKLRFEEKLSYTFFVDKNIQPDFTNIPTMLIQPYIENALKHGLLHKKTDRQLAISLKKSSNKTLECIIEDNGIGRKKAKEINDKKLKQHKSFALKANTERLDLLNYGKERKIGVEIVDLIENEEAKGTKVILKIPILKTS